VGSDRKRWGVIGSGKEGKGTVGRDMTQRGLIEHSGEE